MAKNTITVTYKIKEDGSLQKISKKADKAAKSTEKLGKSTDRYNKKAKGVGQAGLSSAKGFSKMAQGSNGLVAAYATLAANIFALTALFGALKNAAQFEILQQGFERLGNAAGRTSTVIANQLRTITDNAISMEQALRTSANAFSAGFSDAELVGLTKVAKGASAALGRDLPDALDRLVRGTAKLEPEILDELGIFVKIDDAVKNYASSLGKSVSQITATERRQAFLNETLTQGAMKFGDIAENIDTNPYDKLAAAFDGLSKGFLNMLNFITPLIELLSKSTFMLLGVLVLFGTNIAKFMFPALQNLGKKYGVLASQAVASAEKQIKAQKSIVKSAEGKVTSKSAVGAKTKFAQMAQKMAKGEKISTGEIEKAHLSLARSIRMRRLNEKKFSGKALAAHRQETFEIMQQKRATEKLMRSRAGLGKMNAGIASAQNVATGQAGVGKAIGKIEGASGFGGFAIAREEYKTLSASAAETAKVQGTVKTGIKFLDKGFAKMAPTLVRASGAVRLFGAAFLSALGPIGWILFAIGLLITAFVGLYKWLSKPTEAEKRLAAQTEALTGKLKQLKETNDKLLSGYREILIEEQMRLTVNGELTQAMIEQISADSAAMAESKAYANTLKVTAGVIGELADGVGALRKELIKEADEFTTLDKLSAWVSSGVAKEFNSAMGYITKKVKSFFDMFKLSPAQLEVWNRFKTFFSDIKAPDVLVGVAQSAAAALDSFLESGKKALQNDQVKKFTEETLEAYTALEEGLKDNPIALKQLEAAFKEVGGIAKMIETEMAIMSDTTLTAAERADALAGAMDKVTIRLAGAKNNVKRLSDVFNEFGANVKDAQSNVIKFFADQQKKNPYKAIGESVSNVQGLIEDMQKASGVDGAPPFSKALTLALKNNEIDLKAFGLTEKEVMEHGAEAFQPFIDSINAAADAMDTAKSKMGELKASLTSLNTAFSTKNAADNFAAKMSNLNKYGKFSLSVSDQLLLNQQKISALLSKETEKRKNAETGKIEEIAVGHIARQLQIKNQIVDLELLIQTTKLDTAILQAEAGSAELTNLQTQLTAVGKLADARKLMNTLASGADIVTAKATFQETQQTAQSNLLSSLKTGSTADRIKALNEGGGLDSLTSTDEDGNIINENLTKKIGAFKSIATPLMESLAKLGPEGELIASMAEGAFIIADSFTTAFENIDMSAGMTAANMSEGLGAAAAAMGAIGSIMQASSKATIAGIDQEIEAEKRRDGKSAGSLAKISALEKKKEKEKRKAFETNKKMQMSTTVLNTAAAIMGIWGDGSAGGWITKTALSVMVGALGAAQLAVIAGTSYQGGGAAGGASMPSKVEIGSRSNTVDLGKGNNAGGELAYMRGESGQGTGATNFKPTGAFSGYKGRAAGGYIVGEQGPEIFMPEIPGEIMASGQGGGSTNVSFNIQAVDAAGVEEVLLAQKGHIIRMIREAANEHGEFFLEGIRDEAYAP